MKRQVVLVHRHLDHVSFLNDRNQAIFNYNSNNNNKRYIPHFLSMLWNGLLIRTEPREKEGTKEATRLSAR